jgi:hypothetical protein
MDERTLGGRRMAWAIPVLVVSVALAAEQAQGADFANVCASAELNQDMSAVLDQEMAELAVLPKPSYGVAFSGGGSRSAAATLGQLRGLHRTGLIDRVRYISAVSGGAWTALPYTYLRDRTGTLDAFLGDFVPPSDFTNDTLRVSEKGSFARGLDKVGAFSPRLLSAQVTGRGNETFADIVGKEILEPFDLDDRKTTFGPYEEHLDPEAKRPCKISFVERELPAPYLIIGGTVQCGQRGDEIKLPFEITPLYTGIPPKAGAVPGCPSPGYIESYAFDNLPEPDTVCGDGRQSFRIENKKDLFTLSDALGVTSSAPGLVLGKGSGFQTASMRAVGGGYGKFKVRDGGGFDNLGIIPLLLRKVEVITVFVNSGCAITKSRKCEEECEWKDGIEQYFKHRRGVFERERFSELTAELLEKHNKKEVVISCGEFRIRECNQLGIPDYAPWICWVYLDATAWKNQLSPRDQKLVRTLKDGSGSPFCTFPHYRTFRAEGSRLQAGDLDKKEINALSQLTTWTVEQVQDQLRSGPRWVDENKSRQDDTEPQCGSSDP